MFLDHVDISSESKTFDDEWFSSCYIKSSCLLVGGVIDRRLIVILLKLTHRSKEQHNTPLAS